MRQLATILLVILVCVNARAQEQEANSMPLDPDYVGIHGMVLVNNGSRLYASHLPMYRTPHNAQLLYAIEGKDNALIFLVRDAGMVTIKPELFNLQRLIRGEKVTLKADVYIGHFERGGMKTYSDMEITFTEQLYVRMLRELGPPQKLQKYDSVELRNDARMLIHQIQGAPSYDHLVLVYQSVGCVTEFTTSDTVPSESLLLSRLSYCGSIKPLHYEVSDFSE